MTSNQGKPMMNTMPAKKVAIYLRPLMNLLCLSFLLLSYNARSEIEPPQVDWHQWDSAVFNKAATQEKLLMLDLEAVWCHWCHVMNKTTYQDPRVVAYLKKHFVAIKVDQDSRPDLALKYKDYGWPATIFFSPKGTEIVKRAGFMAPDNMLALLKAIVNDPSPENLNTILEKEEIGGTSLPIAVREQLLKNYKKTQDLNEGGLTTFQKFIDADSLEFALNQLLKGDRSDQDWIKLSLDNALAIQDSEWGGFYQYSTYGNWKNPHFEKIMKFQARYVKIYALAFSVFRDPKYLNAAKRTAQYVEEFLSSPDGAFYVSQDADLIQGKHSESYFALNDKERRKQGLPKIDTSVYARENGWFIEALAYLYEVSGDQMYLQSATKALRVIEASFGTASTGFKHARHDKQKLYLADNIAMGTAYLQLYRATANRSYLTKSLQLSELIHSQFYNPTGSYNIALDDGTPIDFGPHINESIRLGRFFSLLFHYSGKAKIEQRAKHVMKYLSRPSIALDSITEPGILLLDQEISHQPLHITIVGSKKSRRSSELFQTGLSISASVKRIEWWDKSEGNLMNEDVQYPQLDFDAAFVCTNSVCSLPLTDANQLVNFAERRGYKK